MDTVKCTRCKHEKSKDLFLSVRGGVTKTCQQCRDKGKKYIVKCEHNKSKSQCILCNGSSFCSHSVQKSRCKKCQGGGLCEHGIQRPRCKECQGSGICIHNKLKHTCKECQGSGICIHNKLKHTCKECQGSGICIHNKLKYTCKECRDPIKITINKMIQSSKSADIKKYRYQPNFFIDKCFIKMLIEENTACHYCKIEMQFIEYNDDLCTIERLDNKIGHIKSNCVLACRKCNFKRSRD